MDPVGPLHTLASIESPSGSERRLAELKDAAIRLEASFLAEVLKSAGMGMPRDAFGGGHGEEQFASLLVQEQAERIARAGGIGLAETIFNALKRLPDA
jgi:Rod binding domain-containing protein